MSAPQHESRAREHAPGVLVAALSSAFGVALVQGTGLLDAALRAGAVTGDSDTVAARAGSTPAATCGSSGR